jgi:hypothetical protein
MSMRRFLSIVLVSMSVSAVAQVQSRPTDAPIVTAENESWYGRGDPIQFAGNSYIRAGAAVFFDGNRMVRSGYFNGVPLYLDATQEPYSMVFVPIGRGLMQPYELPRSGNLAGTTGSTAPSFPVSALPSGWTPPMAAGAPTGLGPVPLVAAEIDQQRPVGARTVASAQDTEPADQRDTVPPLKAAPPPTPAQMQKVREKVWIDYRGEKWIPAGPAIPIENSGLVQTGQYAGFPVFSYAGQEARIFLPTLAGLVAPYELKR